jgi:hypothetical protein
LWRILKNLDAFRRYSTFSPYENTECLAKRWVNIRLFQFVYLFWRHWTPRWKGYFVRISMVFFVLKGGEYALKYLRYKTIQSKCRLSWKK